MIDACKLTSSRVASTFLFIFEKEMLFLWKAFSIVFEIIILCGRRKAVVAWWLVAV